MNPMQGVDLRQEDHAHSYTRLFIMKIPPRLSRSLCHTLILLLILTISPTAVAQKHSDSRRDFDVQAALARANKLLEYNGISRAATLYEEVLTHYPTHYPDVAFVLGQIYEYKQDFGKAALFYHMAAAISYDADFTRQAREARARMTQPGWRRLKIIPPVGTTGLITLDDTIVLGRDASGPIEILLPPDVHMLGVKLDDHHPEELPVDLSGDSGLTLHLDPEPFVFFGYLELEVSNHDGALITITQEIAKAPAGRIQRQSFKGSVPQHLKLPTGTYFIEITDPDYERWIRRIHVERDLDNEVDVRLTKALPAEIRYDSVREEEMKHIVRRDAIRLLDIARKDAQKTSSQVASGETTREEVDGRESLSIAHLPRIIQME